MECRRQYGSSSRLLGQPRSTSKSTPRFGVGRPDKALEKMGVVGFFGDIEQQRRPQILRPARLPFRHFGTGLSNS